ncbi:MAG: hypothetical protein WBF33_08695 [Candidatus Nitrosopolaris sp.]
MANRKSTPKKPSCISLSLGIKKKLKYRAIKENRPASSIIEASLKKYFRKSMASKS